MRRMNPGLQGFNIGRMLSGTRVNSEMFDISAHIDRTLHYGENLKNIQRMTGTGTRNYGMEQMHQHTAEQLGITPRSRFRQRAEELSYEYESRQVPPEMRRPAPTESIQMKEQSIEQTGALEFTPAFWITPSLAAATTATQKSAQVSATMTVPQSDVASISAQAQEQRAGQVQIPALLSMLASANVPISAQKSMQYQIQTPKQFQVQIPSQLPWQETLQNQRQTPVQVPVQITPTMPIIPQIQIPYQPVPTKPWKDIPFNPIPEQPITPRPPVPTVPWLPSFPSFPSSGPGPFGRKRRAAFTETFSMGLDYSLRRPSKKKGKSWTSPKYPKQIKTGGKKK